MPFQVDPSDAAPAQICLQQVTETQFKLLQPFVYVLASDRPAVDGDEPYYSVPAQSGDLSVPGQTSDLASVPRALWGLVASYGLHTAPALLHDKLCVDAKNLGLGDRKAGLLLRRRADRLFRWALSDQCVPWATRWLLWSAVSAGAVWSHTRVRRALLIVHLVLAVLVLYWALYSILRPDGPALPLPRTDGVLEPFDGWWLLLAALAPAASSVIWWPVARMMLVGAYAAAFVLPLLVLTTGAGVLLGFPSWLVWRCWPPGRRAGCPGPPLLPLRRLSRGAVHQSGWVNAGAVALWQQRAAGAPNVPLRDT